MILCIKNIGIEGPETLGNFFKSQGLYIKEIDLSLGALLPEDLSSVDAIVCLGGPMNVYQEDEYPFLKKEIEFIKQAIGKEIPFLGLCLGSQLLAKAAGSKVIKSPIEEIGFSKVVLTDKGREDKLFENLDKEIDVFQWHGDMFEVPNQGVLLATSSGCPSQAFKIGDCAYGFQFHVEITEKSIIEWSQAYFDNNDMESVIKLEAMLKKYVDLKENFNNIADKIYNNFLKIIVNKTRVCK